MEKIKLEKIYLEKRRFQKGFSLMEVLAATLVLLLIASALAVGIPASLSTYQQVTATAEATTLLSTLSQSLADELRYAQNIKLQSDLHTLSSFTSAVYGQGIKPVALNGFIQMEHTALLAGEGTIDTTNYPLLSEAVYTKGLQASIGDITYAENTFSLNLAVYLPANTINANTEDIILAETKLKVRAINE